MITVKVTTKGLEESIAKIETFLNPQRLREKGKELCERLAYIGVKEASIRFSQAYDPDGRGVSCYAEPTENGWRIVAEGEDVCFIEFGAGVYYNGTEPYPLPRPEGIYNIGEYVGVDGIAKGHGKQDAWWYTDSSGQSQYTHGTPAAMPLYHATKEMLDAVSQIANEVFNND